MDTAVGGGSATVAMGAGGAGGTSPGAPFPRIPGYRSTSAGVPGGAPIPLPSTRFREVDMHVRPLTTPAAAVALAALAVLSGCDTVTTPLSPDAVPAHARAGFETPGAHRQYGPPVKLGAGMARAYVVRNARDDDAALELGVALDARSLQGLSGDPALLHLRLPARSPEPYRFVMLDWNPGGHEPPGVYDVPHFDFHFYTVPEEDVAAIDPADPAFADEANNLPTGDHVPPHYAVLAPPGLMPADVAVPGMGVHWIDVRAPELQGMFGNPDGYEPFTATFIYGSWDGRITFLEPMITRDFLLGHPDEVRELPQPAAYPAAGWYPAAYRITYDPQAREYRVALTELGWHE